MGPQVGKVLMILGGFVFVAGLLVYFSDRLPFLKSVGRLPGDMSWKGEGWQVHFPLATSILLSLLLTGLMWLVNRFSGKS